jgi:hypothetical protein
MKQTLSLLLLVSLACAQIVHADNPKLLSQEIFRTIYALNAWGDTESRSGPGSNTIQTTVIRVELPKVLEKLGTQVLLDAGCGDHFWMGKIRNDFKIKRYIGVDVVPDIVLSNMEKYGDAKHLFMNLDILRDELPGNPDTIICRDVLAHLTFEEIWMALRNFKKCGATYFIVSTYPTRKTNPDIDHSSEFHLLRYRPLNFQAAPFNFPAPLMLFNEKDTEGGLDDKSFAVWRIADLPIND